jgi:hypothetical protein
MRFLRTNDGELVNTRFIRQVRFHKDEQGREFGRADTDGRAYELPASQFLRIGDDDAIVPAPAGAKLLIAEGGRFVVSAPLIAIGVQADYATAYTMFGRVELPDGVLFADGTVDAIDLGVFDSLDEAQAAFAKREASIKAALAASRAS